MELHYVVSRLGNFGRKQRISMIVLFGIFFDSVLLFIENKTPFIRSSLLNSYMSGIMNTSFQIIVRPSHVYR